MAGKNLPGCNSAVPPAGIKDCMQQERQTDTGPPGCNPAVPPAGDMRTVHDQRGWRESLPGISNNPATRMAGVRLPFTICSALHLHATAAPHAVAGHIGDDGGRKMCPPSTPTGLPHPCKTYAPRRWIAEHIAPRSGQIVNLFRWIWDDLVPMDPDIRRSRISSRSRQICNLPDQLKSGCATISAIALIFNALNLKTAHIAGFRRPLRVRSKIGFN